MWLVSNTIHIYQLGKKFLVRDLKINPISCICKKLNIYFIRRIASSKLVFQTRPAPPISFQTVLNKSSFRSCGLNWGSREGRDILTLRACVWREGGGYHFKNSSHEALNGRVDFSRFRACGDGG